MAEAGLLKD